MLCSRAKIAEIFVNIFYYSLKRSKEDPGKKLNSAVLNKQNFMFMPNPNNLLLLGDKKTGIQ